MNETLKALYNGEINPQSKATKKGSILEKEMENINLLEEKLINLLEGDNKKSFYKYVDAHSGVDGITGEESFIAGFKLGLRIGVEAMGDDSDNLDNLVK